MKKKAVIALGHRALGTTLPEQKIAVKKTAIAIANLIEDNYQIVITHSNAPQVGMIHTAMNEFGKAHEKYTPAPISVCSAMSQGYIGYDLQNAIREELLNRGIFRTVTTVLTQVLVDAYDETFANPTKVIGRYLTKAEADLEEAKGNYVIAEPDNLYRRIVASPEPIDIIEIEAINALLQANQIVIACGGGGIPVLKQGNHLRGASAIIEKDLAGGLLAELIDADEFIILTSVEHVSLNFGKSNETSIKKISTADLKTYTLEGHFEASSMLPKISASIDFIEKSSNRKALITSFDKLSEGLKERAGTTIY